MPDSGQSLVRVGDIVPVSDEQNAFNRRNGLPRYRGQEVLAILKPGERACDHGFHGSVYGYLNAGENRLLLNNSVGSRRGDTIFWPLNHNAAEAIDGTHSAGQDPTEGL